MDLLSGGAGADAFYGSSIDNNETGTSLNPGDSLSGGAGIDMLSITLSGSTANPTIPLQTNGVEKISVGNYNSFAGDDTLALAAASDVTDLMVTGSGATAFTGVRSLVNVMLSSSTGATTVTYGSGPLSGTADTQSLTLSGSGSSSSPVAFKVTGASSAVAETLAIKTEGSSSAISLDASNDHKTITVSGSAGLTIVATGETTITTVDASAATGGVAINDLGASKLTVIGGAGNDSIRISGATIDTDDSINAGDGVDTLSLTVAANITSATNGAKVVGFENVYGYLKSADADVGAGGGAGDGAVDDSTVVAQDVSLLGTAPTTVGVASWSRTGTTTDDADETATDGVNFTNMAAGTNLAISGIAATGTDANDGLIINFTATADLKTDTTADAITVTLGSSAAAATSATTGANTRVNLTLALDDYETVTLVSQGGANTIAGLDSSDLKKLIINASKALTITDTSEPTTLRTIDASGSTADVDVDAFVMDGASTLIGGSGNDQFQGSSAADSILGGSGSDSITGANGNDFLDGGDGNDTITGGTGADTILGGSGDDLITGGSGNDSLDGGAGNDTFVINATDVAAPVLDLSSSDKLSGGDGTDGIQIDGTYTAAREIDLSLPAETRFAGVTSVEKITLNTTGTNAAVGATTLKVGDIALGSFPIGITIDVKSSNVNDHSVNASPVLNSGTKITFNGNSGINTYTIGNGIDNVSLSSGNDFAVVSNILFLQGGDSLGGGTGADTLTFTATGTTSVTVAQMVGVSGFEALLVDTNDASAYTIAIDDAFVTANKDAATDTMTITRDSTTDTGTLKIDASAITTGKLAINGGSGADTITGGTLADALDGGAGADSIVGGAGNDTITGGNGIDTVTGGAGSDTFKVSAATSAGRNKVTDFTAGTGGDVFNLNSGIASLDGSDNFATSASLQAHAAAGPITVAAASEVVIITSGTIANNLALTTTANDLDGTNLLTAVGGTITVAAANNQHLFAISDQFGNVGVYYGDAGADTGIVPAELALVGVLQATSLSSLVFGNFGNGA